MFPNFPLPTGRGEGKIGIRYQSSMAVQKSSGIRKDLKAKKVRIALIMSRFNGHITQALFRGALQGLQQAGVRESDTHIVEVPGAFEIPLAAKTAAKSKKFDGIICLGAVIRGETPHFDYVCQGATQGILQAQLETGVPMAFGILTTNTVDQALARAGEPLDENKGFEAAKVVIEMIETLKKVKAKR